MLHHEESPEKPQYKATPPPISRQTPPFCLPPPFSGKNFQTPPFPSILKKLNPAPLYEGGGGLNYGSTSLLSREDYLLF